MEEEAKRKNISAISGRKRATDSKGQMSTKAATAVIPRIYLSRILAQEPQAMVLKGYLGKNFKDRAIWYFSKHTLPQRTCSLGIS